jgi:hypothetical protein
MSLFYGKHLVRDREMIKPPLWMRSDPIGKVHMRNGLSLLSNGFFYRNFE